MSRRKNYYDVILKRQNDISLKICGGSEAEEESEAAKQKGHTCFKYVWPFCYHYALKG